MLEFASRLNVKSRANKWSPKRGLFAILERHFTCAVCSPAFVIVSRAGTVGACVCIYVRIRLTASTVQNTRSLFLSSNGTNRGNKCSHAKLSIYKASIFIRSFCTCFTMTCSNIRIIRDYFSYFRQQCWYFCKCLSYHHVLLRRKSSRAPHEPWRFLCFSTVGFTFKWQWFVFSLILNYPTLSDSFMYYTHRFNEIWTSFVSWLFNLLLMLFLLSGGWGMFS